MRINSLDELLDLLLELTEEHCNGTKWMCDSCPLREAEDCMETIIEAARSLEWRNDEHR